MGFFDDDDDSGDKCPYYDLNEGKKTQPIHNKSQIMANTKPLQSPRATLSQA